MPSSVLLLCLLFPLALCSTPIRKTLYNEAEARRLLHLSAGAYGHHHDECINSYIVVSDVKKEIVVVYRGTTTKVQLFTEAIQSLSPHEDFHGLGPVNLYFLTAHEAIWPDVESLLKEKKYQKYKVVFTGHSLGGALATLSAARTVVEGLRPGTQVKVLTFGEPRVGGIQFAKNFDEIITECYRVVFRKDVVPHLPACEKDHSVTALNGQHPCSAQGQLSYHQGIEIWYPHSMQEGSEYHECVGEPRGEDFECSDKLRFHKPGALDYVSDHRHYFDVAIADFGKAGCQDPLTTTRTTEGKLNSFFKGVSAFFRRLGFE